MKRRTPQFCGDRILQQSWSCSLEALFWYLLFNPSVKPDSHVTCQQLSWALWDRCTTHWKDNFPSDKEEMSGQCNLRRKQRRACALAVDWALHWLHSRPLLGRLGHTGGGFAHFCCLPWVHILEELNSQKLAICVEGTLRGRRESALTNDNSVALLLLQMYAVRS